MELIESMTRDMLKEIGNKSREFYEFVLPPIDIEINENLLKVIIDIPGFKKEDIKLTIHKNIISINANKYIENKNLICQQRPKIINKKIRIPIDINDKVETAKYENGTLVLSIPIIEHGKDITIE